MKQIQHKGCLIRVRAYQVPAETGDPQGWNVEVTVASPVPGGVHDQQLHHSGRLFRTREEAEEYGFAMGRKHVDEYR